MLYNAAFRCVVIHHARNQPPQQKKYRNCQQDRQNAVSSFAEKAEKIKYKQKFEQAEKSAKTWKQRYDALHEQYQELKKKAQPFLDALEIASERVRAFLDVVLSRGKETQEHEHTARKRGQDMEL